MFAALASHRGKVVSRRCTEFIGGESNARQREPGREHVMAIVGHVLRVEIEQREIAEYQPQRREGQRQQRDHRREQTAVRQVTVARHQRADHRDDRIAGDRRQQHHQARTGQQCRRDTVDRRQSNLGTLEIRTNCCSFVRVKRNHVPSLLNRSGRRVDGQSGAALGHQVGGKRRAGRMSRTVG